MLQLRTPGQKYALLSFLFLSLFCFTISKAGCLYDTNYFMYWAGDIYLAGLGNVYNYTTDYLPFFHYFLKIYVLFQSGLDTIQANIHYLKIYSFCFHLLIGYLILRLQVRAGFSPEKALFNTSFYLLNVAVLYNTMIWNQVDIILSALVFAAIYLAYLGRTLVSITMMVLALNFKLHAIVFVPVFGLMVLPELVRSFRTGRIVLYVLAPALLQVVILIPFIQAGTLPKIVDVVTGSVGKHPFISVFAYNFWHLVLTGELYQRMDTVVVAGLTYKQWGLVMFCITSAFALFPLIKRCYLNLKNHVDEMLSIDKIMLICALIPFLFFFFNTQMHERYSHPALAFLITYCILQKRPLPAITASLAYLLNLEDELKFLQLKNYDTVIFDPVFIALLYLFTIAYLFVLLYKKSEASSPAGKILHNIRT